MRSEPSSSEPSSTDRQRTAVEQDMFTVLHGEATPVVTRWSYTADDPFAVTLAVRTGENRWVDWLLARELVVDSLSGPAGLGDVRMSPQVVQGYDIVEIEISSVDGRAVLEVDRDLLTRFVRATVDVVAIGDEARWVDLDGEIAKIMQGCPE
jgi:Streptomyces sporulation and cell division protein, SsgA